MENGKFEITLGELKQIIKEEAVKLKTKIIAERKLAELEVKKAKLLSELAECGYEMEEGVDEGFFGPSDEEKEVNRQEISAKVDELLAKYPQAAVNKDKLLQKAAANKFRGNVRATKSQENGKIYIVYKNGLSGIEKWASGATNPQYNK